MLPAPTLSSSGRGGKCRRIGVVTTGDVATTTRGVVVGQAKSTCGGRGRRTGERGLGDFNSLGFPSTQFTQRCTRDLASTEAGLVVNVGVGSRVVGALAMTRGDVGGAIVGGAGLQRTGTREREGSINQSIRVSERMAAQRGDLAAAGHGSTRTASTASGAVARRIARRACFCVVSVFRASRALRGPELIPNYKSLKREPLVISVITMPESERRKDQS